MINSALLLGIRRAPGGRAGPVLLRVCFAPSSAAGLFLLGIRFAPRVATCLYSLSVGLVIRSLASLELLGMSLAVRSLYSPDFLKVSPAVCGSGTISTRFTGALKAVFSREGWAERLYQLLLTTTATRLRHASSKPATFGFHLSPPPAIVLPLAFAWEARILVSRVVPGVTEGSAFAIGVARAAAVRISVAPPKTLSGGTVRTARHRAAALRTSNRFDRHDALFLPALRRGLLLRLHALFRRTACAMMGTCPAGRLHRPWHRRLPVGAAQLVGLLRGGQCVCSPAALRNSLAFAR